MSRRRKLIVAFSLALVGLVLVHASIYLSSVPHGKYDTLETVVNLDASLLLLGAYLLGSWAFIVDRDEEDDDE